MLQVSTLSPPLAASMQNVGQAGPAGSLSIPRLCLALGNVGWADPGSFDLGHGEEEVSLKPLQSHFLQSRFQPRVLHSPLPGSSCTCSEAARHNRPRIEKLSNTHGCCAEFTQRPRRTCGSLGFLWTTASPETYHLRVALDVLWSKAYSRVVGPRKHHHSQGCKPCQCWRRETFSWSKQMNPQSSPFPGHPPPYSLYV